VRAYNHKYGQTIETDVPGLDADRAFLSHVVWADPAASDADAVGLFTLTAATQSIASGLVNPDYARALAVVGSAAGIAGDVVITGTNLAGETITETLALNGTTAKAGTKAFKTVTRVVLPVQTNAGVKQVETATAAGTVTAAGRAKCVITADGMPGSPWHVPFDVELGDDANDIAAALRAALAADEIVPNHFDVSGDNAEVVLTAKTPAANDDTLNIAISDGEGDGASVGVTTAATSANTTAGVADDQVSVGTTDALGLPYKLAHNTVQAAYLDNTKDAGPTVAVSATTLELNTVDLNSALNGKAVDVYLFV
jgi:hypothetical protein